MTEINLFALSMIIIGLLLVIAPCAALVARLILPDDWPSFKGRIASEPKYLSGLVEPNETTRVGETINPCGLIEPLVPWPRVGPQWRKEEGSEHFSEHFPEQLKRAMRDGM